LSKSIHAKGKHSKGSLIHDNATEILVIAVKPAAEVKESVLKNASAFPFDRDEIHKRIILEVQTGKGKIIDNEKEVVGYPYIIPVYRKFDENE